jgi:UDP-N-acetylmuramate--alanine ligase
MSKKRILISGGGTGGHIFPAVSIANGIKESYPDSEILFVGAEGRMEMEKVPAAGYPIKGLPIQGLYRPLYSPKNVLVAFKYLLSLRKANQIIQSFKPDIAIGVGGYASAAVVEQAAKQGIPTLIQEQNSFAGQTNKRLGKYCQKICVAYDNMERFFPADKIIKTGNPVRQNLLEVKDHCPEAYRFFGLDAGKKTLLIIGGSLGARTINQSILKDIEVLYKQYGNTIQVIWQTGKFYIDEIKQATASLPIQNMVITDFIARMDYAYSIADLVISRAGASSISELSLLAKPCILVPSPNVSEDHQTKNAMALVERNAAVMVTDKDAPQKLVSTAMELLQDTAQLQTLQKNVVYFARPHAAQQIVAEVAKLVGLPVKEAPQPAPAKKQYFFLGIGGIGMSAIARYFHQKGHLVAGYDLTRTPLTQALENEGIHIHYEDDTACIPAAFLNKENTVVIYTPAIPANMSEWVYFQKEGFTLLKRSQVLGELTRGQQALCVAGTHGKTTTSTLLAHLLNSRKEGVNAFLGGISKNYQSNLLVSQQSNDVVVEADEYDRSFLQLRPNMAIITATDADHLDIYGTHEQLLQGFADFTSLIVENGVLVMKKGLPLQPQVAPSVKVYTYSSTEPADYYAENIYAQNGELYFDFVSPQGRINQLSLGVPVLINVENAVAAMAIAQLNGATDAQLREAIASFQGSKRRFDIQVKNSKHVYIDDYAHHPAEIEACVSSIRHLYPDKKICGVFQPHLYTRTRDFATEFAQSLSQLDDVILLEIYPARELPIEGVNAALIGNQISHTPCTICAQKEALVTELKKHTFDVLITIGAGNIDQLVPQVTDYVSQL